MVDRTSVAPLIAINAVVMDTETTGLDPANARVIEIGAVRLTGGRLADTPPLRRLVRPDIPIPADSTRIHGFDDAAVVDAPRFAAAWPELAGYFDNTVLIGHSIGFDLAVLERECARAKIPWTSRPSLCTRHPDPDRQSGAGGFLARPCRKLARCRGDRATLGAGRRDRRRQDLPETGAAVAQSRHPHARRSDPRHRLAAAIDRRAAARRLDRRVRRAGRSVRRLRAAHRHLSLPAPGARDHVVATAVRVAAGDAGDGDRADRGREDFVGLCACR